MELSESPERRLPGEMSGSLGKSGSYSPTPGNDSTDSVFGASGAAQGTKPVVLSYRTAGGVSPSEAVHPAPRPDLGRMGGGGGRRSPSRKEWWTKPKMLMVGGALCVVLLLLIILPVALTVAHRASTNDTGTDANETQTLASAALLQLSASSTTASPSSQGLDDDPWLGAADDEAFQPILPDASNFRLRPPPVANCSGEGGFVCTEDGSAIGDQLRCDGIFHCPLGSDEHGCEECRTSFSCDGGQAAPDGPAVRKCLRGERLCDGYEDCADGRDEREFCDRAACAEGEYRCEPLDAAGEGVTVCVPEDWLCDGDAQCPFEDDERDCDGACGQGALWCEESQICVPPFQLCDGARHCPDGLDEEGCTCDACQGPYSVLCSAAPGRCVDRTQLCDGLLDCPQGEDEQNCPGWCTPDSVPATKLCADGEEYPLRYACSGKVPACDAECDSCDPEVAFACPQPSAGPRCVPRRALCDGTAHCADGADEAADLCSCEAPASAPDAAEPFRCPPTLEEMRLGGVAANHTKCVPASFRCDGFWDCADGADERGCEEGCGNMVEGLGSFHCAQTGECFPSTARCDGVPDCPDFSDEDGCDCTACKAQPYPTHMCAHRGRCLRRDYVCNPNSQYHCPGPDPDDRDGQVASDQAHCSPLFDPLAPNPL